MYHMLNPGECALFWTPFHGSSDTSYILRCFSVSISTYASDSDEVMPRPSFTESRHLFTESRHLFTESRHLFTESRHWFTESRRLFTESRHLFTESRHLFTESRHLFTESLRLFTESRRLFTESRRLFTESRLFLKGGETNHATATAPRWIISRIVIWEGWGCVSPTMCPDWGSFRAPTNCPANFGKSPVSWYTCGTFSQCSANNQWNSHHEAQKSHQETQKSYRTHTEITQKSHRNHTEIIQKSHRNHTEILIHLRRVKFSQYSIHIVHTNPLSVNVQQKISEIHTTWHRTHTKRHRNHTEIARNHTEIEQKSHRNHTEITQKSHRNHTEITQKSHRNHTLLEVRSTRYTLLP
jgi:hypothetical protein